MLASIAGRSPRQMNQVRTLQLLPGVSAMAAVVLMVLLLCTALLPGPTPDSGTVSGNGTPISVLFEEDLEESSSDRSTVLTALLIEGMNP